MHALLPLAFILGAGWWLMQPRRPTGSPSSSSLSPPEDDADASVSGTPAQFWRDAFAGRDPIREERRRVAAQSRARARQAALSRARHRPLVPGLVRPPPRRVVVQPAALPLPPVPAAWVTSNDAAADCASLPPLAMRDAQPQVIAWWLQCPGRSQEDVEELLNVLMSANRYPAAQAVVSMLEAS